jgi:hypothetical protein
MKIRQNVLVVGSLLVGATVANAQTITIRESKINRSWVYGACFDSHSGNDELVDNTPVLSDTESQQFLAETSGICPGNQAYGSFVKANAFHHFNITGSLSNFSRITAEGLTHSQTAASGLGVATIYHSTPGNMIRLTFTLSTTRNYHLSGFNNFNGNASYVLFQFFDGFTWQYSPFYSLFLPDAKGFYNVSGSLGPGLYRIEGNANTNCQGNQERISSFAFNLGFDDTSSVIQGFVDLQDISGNEAGQTATVKIIQNNNVVDTQTVTLGNDGQYSLSTQITGSAVVAVSGSHWLTKKSSPITLVASGSNTFSPALTNGDCDGNNLVNTDDYLILSNAFDTSEGDAGFAPGADLNEDDIINTDDYLILSTNFDTVGD